MAYALSLPDKEPPTVAEYLRCEKDASTKSEFFNGKIVAMAGASSIHSLLATELRRLLGNALATKDCDVYDSDLRVRVFEGGGFFYPDASVACEDAYFDDADCLRNPLVLVEVLSPSTQHADRVEKWIYYQQLESLRAYVLIAQDQVFVECFERDAAEADWTYRSFSRREDSVRLRCLETSFSLAELYRRVAVDLLR